MKAEATALPASAKFLWCLFALLFITYGYFFQSGQHNEIARLAQIRAVVEQGKLTIENYAHLTADVILVDGRTYPNKAPGTTLLGIPYWCLLRPVVSIFGLSEQTTLHIVCYLLIWGSVGLLSSLLSVCLFLFVFQICGNLFLAFLLTISYGLGTIVFPFSTLFFSHQITAALLFVSFFVLFCLKQAEEGEGGLFALRSLGWFVLSGFLCGFSLTFDYPAILGAIPIGLYVCFSFPKRHWIGLFVAGGVLGVLPMFLYNLLAFGEFFFLTYGAYVDSELKFFPGHSEGFFGMHWPTLEIFKNITIRPERGLFYCNPWLALLIPAFAAPLFSRVERSEIVTSLSIVALFFVFNSGYGDSCVYWGGGASVGPRHLIPMLPFGVLAIAPLLRFRPARIALYFLAPLSIAIMLMATAVEPRPAYEYRNPIIGLFWINFLEGRFAIYDLGIFGHQRLTDNSVSFNWGKLLCSRGYLQLLPLLLFWGVMVRWLFGMSLGLKRGVEIDRLSYRRFQVSSLVFIVFCVVLAAIPVARAFERRMQSLGGLGVKATYIKGINWKSVPKVYRAKKIPDKRVLFKRIDKNINFWWDDPGPPITGKFSVEWKGKIHIETPGDYVFATESDDGSCLYIDKKLLVDNWGIHAAERVSGKIRLNKGQHSIQVRYYNELFGGRMRLMWQPPGEPMQAVPEHVLFR